MYRHSTTISFLVALVAFIVEVTDAAANCDKKDSGTVACPVYIAPTTTSVPHPAVGQSLAITAGVATPLFNGVVPPNGFMVQLNYQQNGYCLVSDNGPAASGTGFIIGTSELGMERLFVTPPGYRPIGPVSILCGFAGTIYIEARGW